MLLSICKDTIFKCRRKYQRKKTTITEHKFMGQVFKSVNPYNNEVIQSYNIESDQAIQVKLKRSEAAFCDWKDLSYEERGTFFYKIATLLESRSRELGRLITDEMGKPIEQSVAEIEKSALVCRHYADNIETYLKKETLIAGDNTAEIYFQPIGAVLQIMPWNFPFWQVFRFAAPTIMAGNVVLLKHAPNVLGCAKAIVDLFNEVGLDNGVFQELTITTQQVATLIEEPEVKGVALTGSVGAGVAVGRLAGQNIKPCVLELGGSDPFIVLEGADLSAAAAAVVKSRMHNSGQTCISAKRLIVEANIYKAFSKHLIQEMEAVVFQPPTKTSSCFSVLARPDLCKNLDRQVRESIEQGAQLLYKGAILDQVNYFPPMLLTNLEKGMPAYDEELFGPVLTIYKVNTAKEAITLANATVFGLGASVWAKDTARAKKVALELEVGAVALNQVLRSNPLVPFGGAKKSGVGRELGSYGAKAFVNVKSVTF
jgi:succinate-semialdehyde dehydrogenase / glutarate-semialdehyde dehydrogenase